MAWEVKKSPSAELYDLPVIGNDIANIGRIIDIWTDPCSPSPEMWVYGFFAAVPTAFVSLTKPELIDVNIPHGRRKPTKGRHVKFHADGILRGTLINVPVPSWRVFKLYEWGQRIAWYFLVADVAESFSINWMSLAYKYNGCVGPSLTYAQYNNVRVLQGSSITPASRRFTWNLDAVSNIDTTNTSAELIVDGTYRVAWQCTFEPYEVPAQSEMPFATHILIDNVPYEIGEVSALEDGLMFASGSVIIDRFGSPNPIIQIAGSWLTASRFCYMSGSWSISRQEDHQLDPDP